MSQQYGPPGQGPQGPQGQGGPWQGQGPGPGQGQPPYGQQPPPGYNAPPQQPYGGQPGYGPGPGGQGGPPAQMGPFGYPPGHQFERKNKGLGRTQLIAIGGGALAVLLVILGVVLMIRGGGEDPAAQPTSEPTLTSTFPTSVPTPTETTPTKGPYDTGVEIGHGVWFTPTKGWVKDPVKRTGASYLLPSPGGGGFIDGWFWARQTELMGAKEFAHRLVDIESNNLEHVVIRSGRIMKCPTEALKECYAINYSAVVKNKTGKKVVFAGFVQAYEDKNGLTTATDSALGGKIWKQTYPQVQAMINSMLKSF